MQQRETITEMQLKNGYTLAVLLMMSTTVMGVSFRAFCAFIRKLTGEIYRKGG